MNWLRSFLTRYKIQGGRRPPVRPRPRLVLEGLEERCLLSGWASADFATNPGVQTTFSAGITGTPTNLTNGPDGNLWFTDPTGNQVGQITPTGTVMTYSAGITPGSQPTGITSSQDGDLWFTEPGGDRIARITPAGVVTEYGAGITPGSQPTGITVGPDGNLWFTEPGGDRIGRFDPSGISTDFSANLAANSTPDAVVTGPDGNFWVVENELSQPLIARITPAGVVTEFAAGNSGDTIAGITVGPDGNLWFTLNASRPSFNPASPSNIYSRVGRITPEGVVTEFSLLAPGTPYGTDDMLEPTLNGWEDLPTISNGIGRIGGITVGPDGNLWFRGDVFGGHGVIPLIGKITPTGTFTPFVLGPQTSSDNGLLVIATGSDGNFWFVTADGNITSSDGNLWFVTADGNIGRMTPDGVLTEFDSGATIDQRPTAITAGPDGNLWFVMSGLSGPEEVERMTPAGVVTEFDTGLVGDGLDNITAGPDGNLWFTSGQDSTGNFGHYLGRITPAGVVTVTPLATIGSGSSTLFTGPDGNLWLTLPGSKRLGRVVVGSGVTEFSMGITPGSQPAQITSSGGYLWFTEPGSDRIGRLTPATGMVIEFSAGITPGSQPTGITAGSDGNVWFTEPGRYWSTDIGRITPDGVVTEFSGGLPGPSQPMDITAGPDGNLWFTEQMGNRIGSITTAGAITEFPELSADPAVGALAAGITADANGNVWFTEPGFEKIGELSVGQPQGGFGLVLGGATNPNNVTLDLSQSGAGSGTVANPAADEANIDQVNRWFQEYLGRSLDGGSVAYFSNVFQTDSAAQVLGLILSSAEFYAEAPAVSGVGGGTPSDATFLQALYQQQLGHAADAWDAAYWQRQLLALGDGTSARAAVAQQIEAVQVIDNNTAAVDRLYERVLGRSCSSADLDYWDGVIERSGLAAAVAGIQGSDEAHLLLVNQWFEKYLGRGLDAASMPYFVNLFHSATEEAVLGTILASAEFSSVAGAATDTAFLQAVYEGLLGHAASTAAVTYWQDQLQGNGRAAVVQLIEASPEYRMLLIQAQYRDLLHRDSSASSAEVDYWLARFLDGQDLKIAFEQSAEFMAND